MSPSISEHYMKREPSSIRKAQILFESRQDYLDIDVVNLAIGNISLPMHPAMVSRMKVLGNSGSHLQGESSNIRKVRERRNVKLQY